MRKRKGVPQPLAHQHASCLALQALFSELPPQTAQTPRAAEEKEKEKEKVQVVDVDGGDRPALAPRLSCLDECPARNAHRRMGQSSKGTACASPSHPNHVLSPHVDWTPSPARGHKCQIGLLEAQYGCRTESREVWRPEGQFGSSGANFDEHRRNRHSAYGLRRLMGRDGDIDQTRLLQRHAHVAVAKMEFVAGAAARAPVGAFV